MSYGAVSLVISEGKPKFEVQEVEPRKRERYRTKKRLKLQRKKEKRKRKDANRRDPRCIRVKGKKKKPRFPDAEARLKYKIEKVLACFVCEVVVFGSGFRLAVGLWFLWEKVLFLAV